MQLVVRTILEHSYDAGKIDFNNDFIFTSYSNERAIMNSGGSTGTIFQVHQNMKYFLNIISKTVTLYY